MEETRGEKRERDERRDDRDNKRERTDDRRGGKDRDDRRDRDQGREERRERDIDRKERGGEEKRDDRRGERRDDRIENRRPDRRPPGPHPPTKPYIVDREKTCPLLLRVFCHKGSFHRGEDFSFNGKEPSDGSNIYTWRDATLRELTDLVKEVNPEANRKNVLLKFAFVYPDKRGKPFVKEVGQVFSSKKGEDDLKTLHELHFEVGDFLDVAILNAP
eukprot:TRINITY_DN2276_c0_g1_i1.p1 TRINITY_DN2276_c0_g1~~TRINITY_DN2276_c0_g1_i1.p1  ORF type:complete len:217 (-),score=60.43 TRINITY_DN2276_c0_g1_i1:249-899(-)